MKCRKVTGFLLCLLMVVSLAGCGSSGETVAVPDTPVNQGVAAKTTILTADKLAELTGETEPAEPAEPAEPEEPDETEEPEPTEESEPTEEPDDIGDTSENISIVTPDITGENAGGDTSGASYTTYRYQPFVLKAAKESNAVFSGESFLTSLDMWREMISGTEADQLKKYISRDYIGFDSSEQLKLVNRVWIDESLTPANGSDNRLADLFYKVDMGDPSSTTTKNSWVSQQTGGLIPYTPSNFSKSNLMDLMSVVSFSDTWATGTKPYEAKNRIFYNADGTETKTVMFRDEGLTYWDMDNAKAYCMYFAGGNYAMIILPDKGVDPAEVDVAALMAGQIPSEKAHVSFVMPGFSTESTYVLSPKDFDLPVGTVSTSVLSGVPAGFTPSFSQMAKVSLSAGGAGNAQPGAAAQLPTEFDESLDEVSIVCNRPFLYYIGDAENEDVAFFGVLNKLTDEMVVTPEAAGLSADSVSSEPAE